MDDKTVIARPKLPVGQKAKPKPPPAAAKKPPVVAKPEKSKDKPPAKKLSMAALSLISLALVLIGLSTSLLTVYLLMPEGQDEAAIDGTFTTAELETDIVPVEDEAAAESDLALIESVIEPKIVELSGDPVVVRQAEGQARQLVKLDHEEARAAARTLGATGGVFRMRDMLDNVNSGLSQGALGSQDDFAFFQNSAFKPDEAKDGDAGEVPADGEDEEGTTVLNSERNSIGPSRKEFATKVKKAARLKQVLTEFGLDATRSAEADAIAERLYGVRSLQENDEVAVLAAVADGPPGAFIPMQVTIYRDDAWIATVAMNDVGFYDRGEDPWHNKDIFAAQLLPDETAPDSNLRLLDAIYAIALRNGLPAAVAGETIMLLSRAHDLEQPVAAGDSISLLYSPEARDTKTGFGRVVYVRITRSAGSIECYVFQPQPGGAFECLTPDGDSNVAAAGMTMPVNGTLIGKFGPGGKAEDGSDKMNFGVDWAAPKGTPVVAAFAGDVTAAGKEGELGNVIRISHPDGSQTTYAYLQKFASGVAPGTKVVAGQTIGFVGAPPFSRETRLHFELRRNGEPVDPVGEMQASIGKGGAVDVFVQRIIYVESANRCNARNPLSTAVGLGQFIESTWMTTIRLHRADLLAGRTRAEVLALRTNCELARAMTTAFTRDNAAVIRSRGHPVTPGHLYLAHFLGVGGALKVLGSHPDRQIADVFGAAHVRANPFERGKSIGYLISWAAKKMGGKTPKTVVATTKEPDKTVVAVNKPKTIAAAAKDKEKRDQPTANTPAPETTATGESGGAPSEPLVKYAGNTQFTELKKNIDLLLR